jgi:hypothetical protein
VPVASGLSLPLPLIVDVECMLDITLAAYLRIVARIKEVTLGALAESLDPPG